MPHLVRARKGTTRQMNRFTTETIAFQYLVTASWPERQRRFVIVLTGRAIGVQTGRAVTEKQGKSS